MLYENYPELVECKNDINKALDLMIKTYRNKGKILVCGNGGSAADCEHIVGELMKGFRLKREVTDTRIPIELRKGLQGALPAISLVSQVAINTAFINDVDPNMVYAQLVYGYAKEHDLLICISTSGNSLNVVNAAKVASSLGISIIALTGKKDSLLSSLASVTIKAPEIETYRIQELHLPIYHYLCAKVEEEFFK